MSATTCIHLYNSQVIVMLYCQKKRHAWPELLITLTEAQPVWKQSFEFAPWLPRLDAF